MSEIIKITEDEFWEQYKPIKNHIDANASYDGCMFETYDAEYEFVKESTEKAPLTVWTILDCDDKCIISEGWHFVNRIGYLITEVPAQADTGYIIEDLPEDAFNVSNIESIASVNMTDIFDYEKPEEVPEWKWIIDNASYQHVRNGQDGIYEFSLNMSKVFDGIPPTLQTYFTEAKTKNIAYLIFHQGT